VVVVIQKPECLTKQQLVSEVAIWSSGAMDQELPFLFFAKYDESVSFRKEWRDTFEHDYPYKFCRMATSDQLRGFTFKGPVFLVGFNRMEDKDQVEELIKMAMMAPPLTPIIRM